MRIGIDAHASERDGSGNCTYIRNFLKELQKLEDGNTYILYATDISHPFYREILSGGRFSVRELPVKNPLLRIPLFLAWQTCRDKLDILHVQYHAPLFHRGKLVATIHDLGFLRVPRSFSRFESWRLRIFVRRTAMRAAKIITGSYFSRDDICRSYGLDPLKVEVIPYGVSPIFRPARERLQKALAKYGLGDRYVLSVGRLNPRKNLLTLVKAFEILKSQKQIFLQLVIAGQEDYKTGEMKRSIGELSRGEEIVFTGFVSDEDLPLLYSGAEVFVYPSLFEGVGLPVLEAMSCGVPVVASDTSSLKEVVAGAGVLVNPLNAEEMAQAIYSLLSAKGLREEYIARGLARAGEFTWEETARKTLAVYQELGQAKSRMQ